MNSFKIRSLIGLLFLLTNCSPRISNYFESTHYVRSFNTHIINDSLRLYIKTPADIQFERDRKLLRKKIQSSKHHLDGLVAYGETVVPPHYKIYLMIDPEKNIVAGSIHEMVQDTLFKDHKLVLLCQTENVSDFGSYRTDCRKIFKSITTNTHYREGIASLFDLTNQFGNHYLEGLNRIQAYPAKGQNKKWLKLQFALTYASFLAPNKTYTKLLNRFNHPALHDSLKQIIRSHAMNGQYQVEDKIRHEAKDKCLIMFNENHFYPNHRIFLSNMLPVLYKMGFKYLALETLGADQDSLLNKGDAPTTETGFYTLEPRYGQLIRKAQQLGFTFVSYENTDSTQTREQGQAAKLFNKTFGQDDSARVVVLAGLDHILENPTQVGKGWLAYIMHKKYNLDPLTISQSHLNSYRYMAKPVALISADTFDDPRLNSVDWLLLNNLPFKDQVPNYTFVNNHDEKVQVSIFFASELDGTYGYDSRIPYRSGVVAPGGKVRYQLPQKIFIQVIYDGQGKVLEKKKIDASEFTKR